MPPITDPALLAQIAQQSPPQVQPQAWPGASLPQGFGAAPSVTANPAPTIHTQQETTQQAAKFPSELHKSENEAKISDIQLEQARLNTGQALGDPKLTGQARYDSIPDQYKGIIDLLRNNQLSQLSGYGITKPQMLTYLNTVKAIDPTFDPSLMPVREKAMQSFTGTGTGAQAIGAINRVAVALQALKGYSDQMNNPNLGERHLNSLVAGVQQSFDPVTLKGYTTILPEVINQADRIMKAVGAPTVSGNAEIMKGLTPNASSAERNEAFTALTKMLYGASSTLRDQWQAAYGGQKAPPTWMSKDTSDFLNSLVPGVDFGGSEWRGLPGLKGDTSPGQATPAGGNLPPNHLNPKTDPAFMFPTAGASPTEHAINPDLQPIKLPAGYQQEHMQFLQQHPPGTLTVNDYIAFRKAEDAKYNELGIKPISSQLDPKTVKDFVDGYNKVGLDPHTPVPTGTVPSNLIEKVALSAPGIALANAANAALVGLPDLLSGQSGRDAMHLANSEHPAAALTGEIGGSLIPIAGLEGGFAKAADALAEHFGESGIADALANTTRGKLATDAGANMIYGGARGYNGADDGHGLGGALGGAVAGAAATAGGHFITEGAVPFISQTAKDAMAQLGDTNLTTMQKLGLGHVEEAFHGVPLSRGAQSKAMGSWNVENANNALKNIPQDFADANGIKTSIPDSVKPGVGSTAFLNNQLNAAYNALKPQLNGSVTKPFIDAVQTFAPAKNAAPEVKAMWNHVGDAMKNFTDENGMFTGQSYVNTQTELRTLADDFAAKAETGDTSARSMLNAVNSIRSGMKELAAQNLVKNGTPELVPVLRGVENGWARQALIQDAVKRGLTNDGVYAPGQYLQSLKKFFPDSQTSTGRAFTQPETMAAQQVLGSSAVPERFNIFHSTFATPFAPIGAALYAPGLKQATSAALFKRPNVTAAIAARLPQNPILQQLFDQPVTDAMQDFLRHKMTGN